MKKNWFEQNPKKTMISLVALGFVGVLALLNWVGSRFFGLGHPVIYDAHPIYGYRPIPNQTLSRNGHTIHINNLGLRALEDWDAKQFANKVLFVGDSVSYGGSYISNNELFSHLAVQPFAQFQAGNAGVNGWGVNNVHALIKEMNFLPAQVIVSTFPEGDFYRGLMRIGGQPFWTTSPRYALDELFQYMIYKINLKKTPGMMYYGLPEIEQTLIANQAVAHLKDLDNFIRAQGRQHLIFISPSRSQMLGLATIDPVLKKLFDQYDLQVIYIQTRLPASNKQEIQTWFYDEIHLSQTGHQQWAQVIRDELKPILMQSKA